MYRTLGSILSSVFAVVALAQSPEAKAPSARYSPKVVISHPFDAITDPKIVSAAEAGIAANELVIGVTVNGQSRAYPINQLTGPRREIINDTLGGTAIAATW